MSRAAHALAQRTSNSYRVIRGEEYVPHFSALGPSTRGTAACFAFAARAMRIPLTGSFALRGASAKQTHLD